MKTEKINVLITAIGGAGPGEQILKALLLVHERYMIVGADAWPSCAQFAWCDAGVIIPTASDPSYYMALKKVLQNHSIQAVFFGCEPEIQVMMNRQKELKDRGVIAPMNPPEVISLCADKEECHKWLLEKGFFSPRSKRLDLVEDYEEIDCFPVIIKPAVGSGGSRNVFIAQGIEDLQQIGGFLRRYGGKYIVQEYIGSPEHEYTVGVLHDLDGEYINTITMRRFLTGMLNVRMAIPNRTGRRELGDFLVISSGISQGEIVEIPAISDTCRRIAQELGAKSAINIQCRLWNNKVYVFEINPRFSGTTSLRAMVGYNEPDILVRKHILGDDIERGFPFKRGTILRGLAEYLVGETKVSHWTEL